MGGSMPLVYLPDAESLFWWDPQGGDGQDRPDGGHDRTDRPDRTGRALPWGALLASARASTVVLLTPEGLRAVDGVALPLLDAAAGLAGIPAADLERLPASAAVWALASKLALELVSRERVVPTIARRGGRLEARWAVALSASEDASRVAALGRSLPPAAHAVPMGAADPPEMWAPEAALRAFLDAVADALVRSARGGPQLAAQRPATTRDRGAASEEASEAEAGSSSSWDRRWQLALSGAEPGFEPRGFAERAVVEGVERWGAPALGARDRLRACFRLELPEADRAPFQLRFLLQSPDDPSLLVPAADVWKTRGRRLEVLGRAFRDPQESLLEALGRAARLFAPVGLALAQARPESLELDAAAAWSFLGEGAALLAEAGFGVSVPGELTAVGQRRLRLRLRVGGGGGGGRVAGTVAGAAAGLGLDALLAVNWDAVIGDTTLAAGELAALAEQKAPLVRFRGAWVAIDPGELRDIQRRLAAGPGRMTVREAMRAALAGELRDGRDGGPGGDGPGGEGQPHDGAARSIAVIAEGAFARVLERLQRGATDGPDAREPPATLRATLRPYQRRGFNWLASMASLGLGACLADDMGLGKTIQLLAYLVLRQEVAPEDGRPALLVAPTSVVGNWERELARFAPTLSVLSHHGGARGRAATDFPQRPATLVVTTYGVLRRDADLLAAVDWSVIALDEAQNIKNAASTTAQAARRLRASHRFALTGTPVENRLAELWSILEFTNPGLLGPLPTFRREFALPIERYGDDLAAARLRRVVAPFVLRRLKGDPAVALDLPAKNEMKVICTLTREQASLYRAVVDEELRRIARAEGIERRGRVLALLTFTKQICNHPAQYLSESGPLVGRSGKLARVTAMLEEAVAAGDKALVFTQFREMGARLVSHWQATLGEEVSFLHGGVQRKARDEMVRRFQEDARGARIFVLSVKAGGTGLNLTAASHVFHYDRWWNPAVEDQATDRAYRIGQTRAVQVHKMVCAGTVEEKIDGLLEHKRKLAAKVVGAGESWITELGTSELRELFALGAGAVVEGDDGGDDDGDDDGVDGDGGQRHADDAHDENGTPGARPQRGASGAPREGKGAPAATVAARAPGRRRRQAPPRTGRGKRPGAGA
jgi:hypothetical protein